MFLAPDVIRDSRRIQAPCELVHFYNAPPGMIEEEILQIIEMEAGVRPQSCKVNA